MHEAPDVRRWLIHYTYIFLVSVIVQCLRYGVSAADSTSVFRFHTHTSFVPYNRQWPESKQGPFEHYGSTLKTRPKYIKKNLITSTVAATGPIPETSCISTHTMENVQRNTDIKTQIREIK